jgi:hypothetical protein
VADVHAALGDRAGALNWLRRAVAVHDVYLTFLRSAAIYDALHDDAEFQALWRDPGVPLRAQLAANHR